MTTGPRVSVSPLRRYRPLYSGFRFCANAVGPSRASSLRITVPIKQAALQGRDMRMEEGLKLESQMMGTVIRSEDAREGPTAFAQKRKPEYKGR